MTIDEAIRHCEEVADTPCFTDEEARCYSEHRQLAEWLKELKAYKEQDRDAINRLGIQHILNHEVKWINERMTKAEQEPCDDAISREAVLDIITFEDKWLFDAKSHNKDTEIAFSAMKSKISEMPSVTPQQRVGRWIEHDFEQLREMGYYRCSECNIGYQRYERGERKSELPNINGQKYELHRIDNYCPNCGAKMEVEE